MIDPIAVCTNTDFRIPSTKIMSEQLSPINENIIITFNEILRNLYTLNDNEANKVSQKLLINNTRWISIISEFRLYVSYIQQQLKSVK